jgi:hypothetical protein
MRGGAQDDAMVQELGMAEHAVAIKVGDEYQRRPSLQGYIPCLAKRLDVGFLSPLQDSRVRLLRAVVREQ